MPRSGSLTPDGLRHPVDLDAWQRWQTGRHPARAAVRLVRDRFGPPDESLADVIAPDDADLLVAVEATHASVDRAVVSPLRHLPPQRTAIVCPVGWQPPATYGHHSRRTVPLHQLATLLAPTAVLGASHHTEIGAAAFTLAGARDVPYFVSQHGAITPFAPPLPPDARLLCWTEADGAFWSIGRSDIDVTVVGSQLLWEAGRGFNPGDGRPAQPATLTYLGQGHAAEISRSRLVHAALSTCRRHGAVYRPHPSERDLASRAVIAAYERAGVTVDKAGTPLVELSSPVVSVFSTGVLEAAARGRDAWVDFPRPPAWMGEFWERYGMSRIGHRPTTAPARPTHEPARRIAEIVTEAAR